MSCEGSTLDACSTIFQIIASVATAIAVFFLWWQLLLTKRQSVSTFEDGLAREYRGIAQRLPLKALLGETLDDDTREKAMDAFYRYFDLTNEQVFLRIQGRVTPATWQLWRDGIAGHFRRPAFSRAWEEISSSAPESFTELRRLQKSGFRDDPKSWRRRKS